MHCSGVGLREAVTLTEGPSDRKTGRARKRAVIMIEKCVPVVDRVDLHVQEA
jgi:hypothetical protein